MSVDSFDLSSDEKFFRCNGVHFSSRNVVCALKDMYFLLSSMPPCFLNDHKEAFRYLSLCSSVIRNIKSDFPSKSKPFFLVD